MLCGKENENTSFFYTISEEKKITVLSLVTVGDIAEVVCKIRRLSQCIKETTVRLGTHTYSMVNGLLLCSSVAYRASQSGLSLYQQFSQQ